MNYPVLLVFRNTFRIVKGSKLEKFKNIEARGNVSYFYKKGVYSKRGLPIVQGVAVDLPHLQGSSYRGYTFGPVLNLS